MIFELNKKDFHRCNQIVNPEGQLEVRAVVEGINSGRIFVDDAKSPKSGLVWLGNNDGFFFIGNEKNEEFTKQIPGFVEDVIKLEAKKVGLDYFEVMGNDSKWDSVIESIFKEYHLEIWSQRVYKLKQQDGVDKNDRVLAEGYHLKEIDRNIYENKDNKIHNITFLQNQILESWASTEEFFSKGIGFCVIKDDNIISVCFSVFIVDNVHIVSIETLENHRGKKLAQKIAHRFVQSCFERGEFPYWDCMEDNEPSIAIAEKLGFVNEFSYKGYYFSFV